MGSGLPRFQQGGQVSAPVANDNMVSAGERAIAQQLRELAGITADTSQAISALTDDQ